MQESPVHEGHRVAVIREDDVLEEVEWKVVEATDKINLDQIDTWTDEQIQRHYQSMAEQLAFQQKKLMFDQIDKTVTDLGNEVSLNGPPSPEGLLAIYEKMEIDFELDGKHAPLTLVCSPEAKPQFERAFEQLHSDPKLRERLDALLRKKYSEWRERESARKLVG